MSWKQACLLFMCHIFRFALTNICSYNNQHPGHSFSVERLFTGLDLKTTGRDSNWTGATLPSCARRVIRARSLLAPESWREYPVRTSLVSPLHTGVVSRHARATLKMILSTCTCRLVTFCQKLLLIPGMSKREILVHNRVVGNNITPLYKISEQIIMLIKY